MKVSKKSSRKREANVTETKTEKSRILPNFWSDFGMLLATFWGPKTLHFLMRFLKSFLGAETDRRVSDGTSTGLRRRCFPDGSPPGGALFARGGILYNDPGTQTRDPTRPGPEAPRI